MKKFFLFVLLFCFSFLNVQSQIKLKGKIVNFKTGETIPYCNVVIDTTLKGTSSNEEGAFVIDIEKFPVVLVFSHIGFQSTKLTVSNSEDFVVKMKPLFSVLESVYLESKTKKQDSYALELAKKAFNKLKENANTFKYGKALYRQKSKNGSVYSELSEIIFDTKYSLNGIEDWDIIEGRYALKKENVNNKNFTLFTQILKSLQPNTKDIIFPLSNKIETYYNVSYIETTKSKNGDVALLRFKPLNNGFSAFKADVYINKINYNVLKIVSSIDDDRLNFVKFNEDNATNKNYHLNYEMVFKENKTLGLVLDYINVNQEFDYFNDGFFKTKVATVSNFTFFEYDAVTSKKKLGRQYNKSKSDWEKLNEIGYNQKFWKDNPIIKRTPVEKEIIEGFENNNAFESIYINSRNQITFDSKSVLNDPFIKILSAEIKEYNKSNPIEKVYLHTDKDVYSAGETIWFSAYALLADNPEQILSSSVLYVDFLDTKDNVILTKKYKLIDGRAVGDVNLPVKLTFGFYTLRGYTPWMRNYNANYFFSKKIKVLNKITKESSLENNKTAVSFFPEGGSLISGLKSKIAFKALGINGLGKKIKGKIINSKNEYVANFISVYNGMGSFSFTPKSGEKYIAVLEDKSTYPLPDVKTLGYTMYANNIDDKSILVKVFANKELRNKPIYIIGQIENTKFYQGKFEFGGNDFIEAEISKNKLPSGVLTITVLDQDKLPFCERVVFVNNQDDLNIKTKISKSKVKLQEQITIDILVTDPNGKPVLADLSMSVTNKDFVKKNQLVSNIYTSLLLEADLKGYIENPYELLKDNERSTKQKLDLVMLTNGWRKIIINKDKSIATKAFSLLEGNTFKGWVKDAKNSQLKNKEVTVVAKSENNITTYKTRTDANGILFLKDIDFTGNVELVFNVLNDENKLIEGTQVIPLNGQESFVKTIGKDLSDTPKIKDATKLPSNINNTIALSSKDRAYMSNINTSYSNDSVVLDEVVLEGKEKIIEEKQKTPSNYGVKADKTIYTKDRFEDRITDLLRGVAGVNVSGNELSIRGGGAPLYIIDGVPVMTNGSDLQALNPNTAVVGEGDDAGSEGLLMNRSVAIPEQVQNLNVLDIERIEVLKGPSAAMYGLRGANGVVLFYSKTGELRLKEKAKLPTLTLKGYSIAKEFYSPEYKVRINNIKKNNESTLFWKPSIITNKNGRASVSFFKPKKAKEFQINIEGLSLYGYPGTYLNTYINK